MQSICLLGDSCHLILLSSFKYKTHWQWRIVFIFYLTCLSMNCHWWFQFIEIQVFRKIFCWLTRNSVRALDIIMNCIFSSLNISTRPNRLCLRRCSCSNGCSSSIGYLLLHLLFSQCSILANKRTIFLKTTFKRDR